MSVTSGTREVITSKPLDDITDAYQAIEVLDRVLARINSRSELAMHIEWAKEAVWAAAYPGGPDDSLLDGLEAAADQVG